VKLAQLYSVSLFQQYFTCRHESGKPDDDKENREMILDAVETVLGYLVLIRLFLETRKIQRQNCQSKSMTHFPVSPEYDLRKAIL
jgi:hypothetical protein